MDSTTFTTLAKVVVVYTCTFLMLHSYFPEVRINIQFDKKFIVITGSVMATVLALELTE